MDESPKLDVIFGIVREFGCLNDLHDHNNAQQKSNESREVALQTVLNRREVVVAELIRSYNQSEKFTKTVRKAAIQWTWP